MLTAVGPDARTYLQGQCSQDLDALAVGESTESLVLSPQGKVDACVRVTRTGEEAFVLDTDAGCGAELLARLRAVPAADRRSTIEPVGVGVPGPAWPDGRRRRPGSAPRPARWWPCR